MAAMTTSPWPMVSSVPSIFTRFMASSSFLKTSIKALANSSPTLESDTRSCGGGFHAGKIEMQRVGESGLFALHGVEHALCFGVFFHQRDTRRLAPGRLEIAQRLLVH